MCDYFAIAENTSVARMKLRFLDRMRDPCGPPPPDPFQRILSEREKQNNSLPMNVVPVPQIPKDNPTTEKKEKAQDSYDLDME